LIATNEYLGEELAFRGGTALHKLHLPVAHRYSEDLDYVRSTGGGVGRLLDTLKDIGRNLGFAATSQISEHPKVLWRTRAENGLPLRIKIEVNTHERSPALPLIKKPFSVESLWWSGRANVRTFQFPELIATKLRALYQRSKGRDLYDMWLALTKGGVDPSQILAAFDPYRPIGYTAKSAVANLQAKLSEGRFRNDLDPLLASAEKDYDIDGAAKMIIEVLLNRL
jgi:predicted nucleotidyltransferase component of viral defense system